MSFEGAGQEEGLAVWRIEDFAPVPYDEQKYGKFNVGDSYIVLNTRKVGSSFSWNVHFWLGEETSQDESGSAAMLAVELDDALGGAPTQHRELQENESQLFLSYFKTGVKYLPGGVKSGFTHYDPEDVEMRLFRVKGKRNVQVKQVPVDISSMNKSDCFILDGGKDHPILVYMPAGARKMEQFRAVQVANEIRDEDHAGNAEVEVIDRFSDNMDKFFEMLGSGSADEVPEGSDDDAQAEEENSREIKLFKVEDEDVTEVSGKPLKQDMLESNDSFLLVGGQAGNFVWLGKESSKEERVKAMSTATAAANGWAKSTKVVRVIEGTETAMFKQFFSHWNETDNPCAGFGRSYAPGSIAEWNIEDLHADNRKRIAKSAGAAIGFMPDDGLGEKNIWRVEDMDLVEVDSEKHGFFFAGDSYVILYKYGDDKSIVYFWQGSATSTDEKGASAIHAARIDNEELGGKAMQVRIVQGKEPRHFIKMFGGSMVVFSGGKASGFNNVHDRDEYDEDGVRMFRVRCASGESDARATQVEENASSLDSSDVFILETPSKTWIWSGQECVDEEVDQAVRLSEIVSPGREVTQIKEGEEEDEFWEALGGKTDYNTSNDISKPILLPRLFHVVARPSVSIRAFEIFNFEQTDLVDDDVMFLDSGDEIYIWVGKDAAPEETGQALELATKYLDSDPTERNSENSTIITVKQGEEPAAFTAIFSSWEQAP
eukprot:TRINITY_DN2546_c0_g1_i5.p1 TRINITY_DN2546_c0_g1~~TRINITY_DN2546_c0_g1_i5.p1  ORF type:complete len:714 (-),score=245.21 TRINITY_DN2546_c0_g1_i5:95-2236(-)